MFEVGDKVMFLGYLYETDTLALTENDKKYEGKVGVITKVYGDVTYPYSIRFDEDDVVVDSIHEMEIQKVLEEPDWSI